MWHSLGNFIYSPIMLLQILASNSTENFALSSKNSLNHTCPNDDVFYPHKDPNLRGCHPLNFQGPCGENMILYSTEEDSTIGECDCDRLSERTLIYHRKTEKCYPIFQQGYCPSGKWLDLRENGLPTCEISPCLKKKEKGMEELVLMEGECVKLGSTSSLCRHPRDVVKFERTRRLPTCASPFDFGIVSIGAEQIKCRPGTYRAMTGRCQPDLGFQWD